MVVYRTWSVGVLLHLHCSSSVSSMFVRNNVLAPDGRLDCGCCTPRLQCAIVLCVNACVGKQLMMKFSAWRFFVSSSITKPPRINCSIATVAVARSRCIARLSTPVGTPATLNHINAGRSLKRLCWRVSSFWMLRCWSILCDRVVVPLNNCSIALRLASRSSSKTQVTVSFCCVECSAVVVLQLPSPRSGPFRQLLSYW